MSVALVFCIHLPAETAVSEFGNFDERVSPAWSLPQGLSHGISGHMFITATHGHWASDFCPFHTSHLAYLHAWLCTLVTPNSFLHLWDVLSSMQMVHTLCVLSQSSQLPLNSEISTLLFRHLLAQTFPWLLTTVYVTFVSDTSMVIMASKLPWRSSKFLTYIFVTMRICLPVCPVSPLRSELYGHYLCSSHYFR